jgi:hypothetical protein
MAWTSGFFNSVNGDRLYNADQMSRIFEGLITDGVYASVGDKLAVQPNNGMTIQIATGRGWFGRHWVNNDSEYTLTLAESDVVLNRYCAVCIRVDNSDEVRDAVPYLKYGEYATNPVKPTMTRTETVKEYCLAYIYIGAGVKEITASVIEDSRANESVCGWVTGLIEQLNSATLFDQFTAIFTEWFGGLQDFINEETEVKLVNALPVSLTVTLTPGEWVRSGNVYVQYATVTNMNTTKSVIASPNSDTASDYAAAEIRCSGQNINALEFTATSLPTIAIKVDIIHMGV